MSWLPPGMEEALARYTCEDRKVDPTDGFLMSCAVHHPSFDVQFFRSLKGRKDGLSAKQRKYLESLCGVPPREAKGVKNEEAKER